MKTAETLAHVLNVLCMWKVNFKKKLGTCTIQESHQEFDNVTTHYPISTCIRKSVKSNVSRPDDQPINQLSKSVVYS